MRQKQDDQVTLWFGLCIAAAVLFIPFAVAAAVQYFRLRKQYLVPDNTIVRIVDFRRAIHRAGYGFGVLTGFVVVAWGMLLLEQNAKVSAPVIAGWLLLFAIGLVVSVLTGMAFAAGLLGVVFDHRAGLITFPTDGVLRSYASPTVLVNAIIPFSVETLKLSEIRGINRQAGRTLLIYGAFGSRAITFSDKLRRDQLLGLLSGNQRFNDAEFAGAGAYA